ncbi:asparagine synthase (glutamine-hydrolyzing) [Sulfurimonas sp.]|uniref:asparagine synthase (glutamine-hydrolyzing) n=1 Tax=Sulfurimonas sp. TaxID=2022749 RepID=UPI002607F15E|nr:asparagine synthase (glutamine-hydrolyzing) [Sulfurimonas sp.]MCW8895335.1 asparagine synthase (glutamine-hydrolyzing) [Sulfurimonas sp.]
MCGIAGFISSNKNYDSKKIVSKMLDLISHRGPDQKDFETYDNTTMGMVRLSIIDCIDHDIPIVDNSGNYSIVYNGEIYNHDSIRNSLKSSYNFRTNSDTETALVSYIKNGVDSFGEHNGMYAFSIYDKQKKETTIVRDKSGEKPLYYTQGKDFFAYASEMKCLLNLVEPRFNDEAVSYEAYEFTVGKETLFKDIYQLEPGEYIKVNNGKYQVYNYWKIWDNIIDIPDNEEKIISDLSELVEDSILLRTKNTAHQYAAFISGGVDSSLIACIAKPDYLYTAHYNYSDFDELDYAKMVAKQINKELIIVSPTKEDFIRTRKDIAYHLDTPCTWTSFTLWMLLERAKKDGIKIVMSGEGADEMFAGYHRYHLLHHDEQIHKLEAMKQYSYLIGKYHGSASSRYAKLVNRCENPYNEKVNRYLDETIGNYSDKMSEDIVHFMGLNDFYSTMQVLLQMSDRLNMAHSIENRSPFLDHRLVQYSFSVQSKYKIKNGITKWILKEVSKKFIPNEISNRTDKRGFAAPINKWYEWDENGKYNRSAYKNMVFEDWKKSFGVK